MKNICKKTITFSIILLLIGVSVSSAISIDTKSTTSNENEEDCNCKEIDSRHLAVLERQLNRIGVYTKLLLVLSRYNPEIKEKCEELSYKILTLEVIKTKLKSNLPLQDNTIICAIIEIIGANFFIIYEISNQLFYYFISVNNSFLSVIFGNIRNFSEVCIMVIHMIGTIYECWYPYP